MTGRPLNNDIELSDKHKWEGFTNWLFCICIVTFDLEIGQTLEEIFPKHAKLSKQEISNICYLAFPDSNSGCMGDTTFIIRVQIKNNGKLRSGDALYNKKCSPHLKADESYLFGYVYFRQVKDISLPRGYFQKSVVILSYFPFNNLFMKLCSLIAPEYFEYGSESLERACANINMWPFPKTGISLNLHVFGSILQAFIPVIGQLTINSPSTIFSTEVSDVQTLTLVDELNLFDILYPVLSYVHLLWELVITCEPIVIIASSPTSCSSTVLALTRLIAPLQYCGDYRPYFTIHDSDFKQYTSKVRGPPPVILGVTNPFFAKTFQHWPHIIRLSEDIGKSEKHKLKKTTPNKMSEDISGVCTSYKPFLQKDKVILKKLMSGIACRRPEEVQSILLKRHLVHLTQSFMIPLERYMASLLPLQKNISPFKAVPSPLPFNPDDFFATLEEFGPHLTLNRTGIKGDWIGLYRKFFRSPNFKIWFNLKYSEMSLKLHNLHLEALSTADITSWVKNKPEVEVVDMVLRIKNKISKCNKEITVNETVKQQLNQRMQDILTSLPDDMKHILQDS